MTGDSKSTHPRPRSLALFERACAVIPGGIYGHAAPGLVSADAAPYYACRAEGCRYRDVDGNEYIDWMCGFGPIVLGYAHPEVEEAAEQQRRKGDCFNHPGPVMVDLAEKLTDLVDFAEWAVFGKNGSDMTNWAIQVAREHTRRRKILIVEGAYHGMGPWCTPGTGGLIAEDRQHVHTFRWNEPETLNDLLRRHRNDAAAVVLTPFHHPLFHDSQLPTPEFLREVESQCRKHGIVLILDDIRAGFRLHVGGSHRHFGFEPDLSCFSKAMGNGYAISAAVGNAALRKAATRVFLSGSFWNTAVAMAAALATIGVIERENTPLQLARTGQALCDGLRERAEKHGLQITLSGPPAMPFMTFSNESNLHRSQRFVTECLKRGVFLHPHHNWFLCSAHTPADVDRTLEVADLAFAEVKEAFGS